MQVAIIITHKKSITTLVWHHGYSELNTSGKITCLIFVQFDCEDDYRTGCRNVSNCEQQESYSGLRSPGR